MLPSQRSPTTGGALILALLLLAGGEACKLDQLVTPLPPAKLSVSPPALDDSSVVGSTQAVSRTLAIQPEGTDKVSWKATTATNSPWLTLKTTSADAPGTLSLTLQPGSLAEGEYGDTVVVTAMGFEDRPVKIPVTFTVRAAPIRLAFTTQPSSAKAGEVISPAVTVTARDAAGRTVTTWNGAVTMSIATNPAAGTLAGTLTITASGGVARFANLAIDKVGSGYVLRAAAGAVNTTSAAFNITSKGGSGSTSTVGASATNINASYGSSSTTITITARDDQGTIVPGALVSVTASGTANNLGPTSGVANAQGVFVTTLSSSTAETKTVSASVDGQALVQHATVTVNPGPAYTMVFGVQPSTTVFNTIITPAVTVVAQDVYGNTAVSFSGDVNLGLAGNLLTGAVLNGQTLVRAVNGVATFGNLSVSRPGNGYTLVASVATFPSVVSQKFNATAF